MIDWTKPVRTKGDKVPVRIICTDAKTYDGQNIVGVYCEAITTWHESGAYDIDIDRGPSGMDLENIPEKKPDPITVMLDAGNKMAAAIQKCNSVKSRPDVPGGLMHAILALGESVNALSEWEKAIAQVPQVEK